MELEVVNSKAITQLDVDSWDYEQSVQEVKPLAHQQMESTIELARALSVAKKALTRPGARTDLAPNSNLLDQSERLSKTWKSYCNDINYPIHIADYWVQRYDEHSDRMLSDKELKQLKAEKAKATYQHHLKLAKYFEKHGAPKPEGWNSRTQKVYEEYLLNEGKGDTVAREKYGNAMPTINFNSIDPEKLDIAEYQAAKRRNFGFLAGVKTKDEGKHIIMFMTLENYVNTLSPEERADRIVALQSKLVRMLELSEEGGPYEEC